MKESTITTLLKGAGEVLHRIKVKLYPLRLPGVKGQFIVRTNNEKVMTVEDVCDSLQNRGGFSGDRELLLDHVRKYYKEPLLSGLPFKTHQKWL